MPSKFFQRVVSLSKTPADFKPQVLVTPGDRQPKTVEDRPVSTVEAGYWRAEGAPGIFSPSRVHRIVKAQDSLTHVEEAVYDVLWGPKRKGEQEEHRTVRMGYTELAMKSRVSKRTIQSIVERLIQKRFIRVVEAADIYHRRPTVYEVRGYAAALNAQRAEGRVWIIKTGRGTFFAHRLASTVEAGLPSTVEVSSPSTVHASSTVTVEAGSPSTVAPTATTSLGIKTKAVAGQQIPSSTAAPAIVAAAIIREFGFVDDDALQRLVKACRQNASDATDEEIAELGAFVAKKISCMRSGVKSPVDLLISQTARCFLGEPFAIYRRENARLKAEQERRIAELNFDDQG